MIDIPKYRLQYQHPDIPKLTSFIQKKKKQTKTKKDLQNTDLRVYNNPYDI